MRNPSRRLTSYILMILVGLFLTALLLSGCSTTVPSRNTGETIRGVSVDEFVIRDCVYLEVEAGSLTHAGDCPNPIHPRRDTTEAR